MSEGEDMVKWLNWDIFTPLCPKGHDCCDQVTKDTTYIYCYDCKKKYFEEDY